jgi:hypothetical protein
MRDVTTAEERRIRDALVEGRKQDRKQATAGTLANFRCEYCKLDFLDPKHPENFYQWVGWDHLIPLVKGGPDDVDNLVCSCWVCNKIKLRYDPSEGRSNPSRAEMIEAASVYIKEERTKKYKEVQEWRDIVYPRQ